MVLAMLSALAACGGGGTSDGGATNGGSITDCP